MNRFTPRTFDTLLLLVLVFSMCGQIDPFTLGRDTFQTEGYVTKQLKVAVCDLALALVFVWFLVRTTQLKAWRKLWWPPLACWALLAALFVSFWHAPDVVAAFAGRGLRGITSKEAKEAAAELVQFAGYFLIAPWLFVNLLHDRRDEEFSRRRAALWAFAAGAFANFGVGIVQLAREGTPRGLWGSPNLYGGFMAVAVPLLWTRSISGEVFALKYARARNRGMVVGVAGAIGSLLTMVTPFAAVAQGFGMIIASILRASARGLALSLIALGLAAWTWRGIENLYTERTAQLKWREYATVTNNEGQPTRRQEVRKQWIEWYVAQGFSSPSNKTFATGVGPGNYQLNVGEYYGYLPNAVKLPPDSNNFYLVQAMSLGVLGLAALLWVWGHFAGLARAAMERDAGDWLGAGVWASLLAWLVVNLFHALIVRGLGLVLAFLFALAVVAWQEKRTEEIRNNLMGERS